MKVFIVYCHPSEDSFTRNVRDSFIKGIVDSGNEFEISDLYKMNFKTDMSEKEYLRDSNYNNSEDIETAKQNGIAPEDYLRCLFEKAPYAETENDWEKLLPWNIEITPYKIRGEWI